MPGSCWNCGSGGQKLWHVDPGRDKGWRAPGVAYRHGHQGSRWHNAWCPLMVPDLNYRSWHRCKTSAGPGLNRFQERTSTARVWAHQYLTRGLFMVVKSLIRMSQHLPSPFPCPDNPSLTRVLWSKRRCHLICYWALIIGNSLYLGKSSRLWLLWKQQGCASLGKRGKEKEVYNNWILIVPHWGVCCSIATPALSFFRMK